MRPITLLVLALLASLPSRGLAQDCPPGTLPFIVNLSTGDAFQTVADAVSQASSGDTIALPSCTFFERGIMITGSRELTLLGGVDGRETAIDGQGQPGTLLTVAEDARVRIAGITFRNGVSPAPTGADGSAINVRNRGHALIRDCAFEANGAADHLISAVVVRSDSTMRIENSTFRGNNARSNSNSSDVASLFRSSLTIINRLITGSTNGVSSVYAQTDAGIDAINCTFADHSTDFAIRVGVRSRLGLFNSVFDRANPFRLFQDSFRANSNNVSPGTTDVNDINGFPVFVDAASGDYRLAAGSPGIDAANPSSYTGPMLDQFGNTRIADDLAVANGSGVPLDCGAFEREPETCNAADLAAPFGVVDLSDIDAFISSFQAGCP